MPFEKGHPRYGGRVAGTPNHATADVKALAGQYTAAAVKRLAAIMNNAEAPHAAQVAAANALLDRACGRPAQASEVTVNQGTGPTLPPNAAQMSRDELRAHVFGETWREAYNDESEVPH